MSNEKLTAKHSVDFAHTTQVQATITVYGKLIANTAVQPSSAGVTHPHGLNEAMQKGFVYGVAFAGQCTQVSPPKEVLLPAPDGPADGCGWDPNEFVVWKNLPRTWSTLAFTSQIQPLHSALMTDQPQPQAASFRSLATTGVPVQDRVIAVVKAWASMPTDPNMSDNLQALWTTYVGGAAFYVPPDITGAQQLASDMNSEFTALNMQPSDLDPAGTITTVAQLANAV